MTQAAPNVGGNGRPRQSHCVHGHAYTEENTYWRADGSRACHICRRARRARGNKAAHLSHAKAATPLVVLDHDALWELLGDVAAQAILDMKHNVAPGQHMPARDFLECAGLLLPDGRVDEHGYTRHIRKVKA